MGYGLPNLERALGNAPNRITLITQELQYIGAQKARVYQIQMPESLQSQGESYDILVEITLSYKAEPRRTRRNRRKYLSTWLDWDCSKRGEDSQRFLERVLAEYNAPEEAEQGEGLFKWTLGKRRGKTADGIVKELSRSIGTVQKDWAIVKSFDLREAFCIAVKGHQGWNTDSDAEVPYALIVSFEAINTEVPLNALFVNAQIPLEVRQEIQV